VRSLVGKVRFVIETHLRTGRPVAELPLSIGSAAVGSTGASLGVGGRARRTELRSRRTELRSRRPHSSPSRVADLDEEEIVALRKELTDGDLEPAVGIEPTT
jgi:hypothetical protein